jgi:uncharacterized protein YqjF (DUF2071 family)
VNAHAGAGDERLRDPDGWVTEQRETTAVFLHWPVATDTVRLIVPAPLELDPWEGSMWVSMSSHRIEDARLRELPPLPYLDTFPELELRTYVRYEGIPGVWFMSFDSPGHFGCWLRRNALHLPYHDADVTITDTGSTLATSVARHGNGAAFDAQFDPSGVPAPAPAGSLEAFLLERYSMFVLEPGGHLGRGDIAHDPWPLQPVTVDVRVNTIPEAAGLPPLGEPARAWYSPGVVSRNWPIVHLDA